VNAMVGLRQINPVSDPTPLGPFDPAVSPSRLEFPEWANHTLTMDKRFTITLDQLFHAPDEVLNSPKRPGNADIDIVISYQPWFLPWTCEKVYRFKTYKQTNGDFYWISAD
jgi:hypothetical protein